MMLYDMIKSGLINYDYCLLKCMYHNCIKLDQICIKDVSKRKKIDLYIVNDICIIWLLAYCVWCPNFRCPARGISADLRCPPRDISVDLRCPSRGVSIDFYESIFYIVVPRLIGLTSITYFNKGKVTNSVRQVFGGFKPGVLVFLIILRYLLQD